MNFIGFTVQFNIRENQCLKVRGEKQQGSFAREMKGLIEMNLIPSWT